MFDAWRYEKSEYIIVPLLHKIYTTIKESNDEKLTDHLKQALKSIVNSLTFNFGALGISINAKSLKEAWGDEDLVSLDSAFSKPFDELQNIPKALGKRRIAVLIDDLDRCSPKKVVSVLESINLVMDISGFIFVLALDYDVLSEAVKDQYPHVSGHVFIQKMVQLPFRVPPLNLEGSDFFKELIPEWTNWKSTLPKEFSNYIRDIATLGLEANPRQIKRLVNSYLLLHRIIEQRDLKIDYQLLIALIGVQLRWPSHFKDFQDSVIAEDSNPFQNFSDDEDEPNLQKYSNQFFVKKYKNKDLRQVLQLTAAVVIEKEEHMEEVLTLSQSREDRRIEFIVKLKEQGFEKSPRSDRLYYNKDTPYVRFRIGKTHIRFEKKKNGTWILWESYLLTRETEFALKVITNPNKHFTNRK